MFAQYWDDLMLLTSNTGEHCTGDVKMGEIEALRSVGELALDATENDIARLEAQEAQEAQETQEAQEAAMSVEGRHPIYDEKTQSQHLH